MHACARPRAQDATFEMERRRNRPEKYDRELVHKTGALACCVFASCLSCWLVAGAHDALLPPRLGEMAG